MTPYFNELDPFPAEWLRRLYPTAFVDDRSIADVQPADLARHPRAHFFAGIGGWELALQLAGWPEGRPVWTGSCPCQPFSAAGKRGGGTDARHLWPEFHRLIAECRPATVFGEQVASADGRAWLSAVRADLEALGYAVGAADLCAAGVGAPHIRQRLYWVAQSEGVRRGQRQHSRDLVPTASKESQFERVELSDRPIGLRADGWLAHTNVSSTPRLTTHGGPTPPAQNREAGLWAGAAGGGLAGNGGLADADGRNASAEREQCGGQHGQQSVDSEPRGGMAYPMQPGWAEGRAGSGRGSVAGGGWDDVEWLPCADGKARPTGTGIRPLAHGVPGRVGQLRAYGNAIVPQVAAEFIAAFMEAETQP